MTESHGGTSFHPILLRQLRRIGIAPDAGPCSAATFQKLLEKISECYGNAEEDRELLERSLDLSSREMATLNLRLETERNRLNTLLTTTEDCVCTLNRNGRVIWGNPAALRLLGLAGIGISQTEESFVFFEHVQALPDEGAAGALLQSESRHRRVLLRDRLGMLTPISYLQNEIAGTSESEESFVVVFREITAELAHEKDLRDARELAKAASQTKSELLANVSHEVRTPLHGILGMTQVLLLEGGLSRSQTECIQTLQVSAECLLHVLNDILDFSKMEAGRLSIEEIPFHPEALLRQVYQFMELQACTKGLHLRWRVEPCLSQAVVGDPTRIRQILLNLVSNAIKFTGHGFVELSLSWKAAGGSLALQFAVSDSGIGIPREQHAQIFEAFSQADNSITRRFGGTGLGLAICSRLASLMGSELTVRSEVGVGSTFCLTIVSKVAPEIRTEAPVKVKLVPLRILYAEDNPVNQLTARKMLRSRGHSVDIAPNGRAALKALEENDYDIILMDHQMPEMSGIEASRAIRGLGLAVPIIAASANAMPEDRERFTAAGMDGFVGKPFTIAELELEIARLLARTDSGKARMPIEIRPSGVFRGAPNSLGHISPLSVSSVPP